jgi:dihydrofolate reductase
MKMNQIRDNFAIIVAMDKNRVIGKEGEMPWDIPEDLKNFRRLTMGNVIVMGRKTHESIGTVLDGRENVVLSRNQDYDSEDITLLTSVDQVLERFSGEDRKVYIIGGGEIYRQFLPHVANLYITFIEHQFDGDTYFPKIDGSEWRLVYEREGERSGENGYRYFFTKYERKL